MLDEVSYIFHLFAEHWTLNIVRRCDAECWSVSWNVAIVSILFFSFTGCVIIISVFQASKISVFFCCYFWVFSSFLVVFSLLISIFLFHLIAVFACIVHWACQYVNTYTHTHTLIQAQTPTVMLIQRFALLQKHISTTHLHNANFFLLRYCFVTVIVISLSFIFHTLARNVATHCEVMLLLAFSIHFPFIPFHAFFFFFFTFLLHFFSLFCMFSYDCMTYY